MKNFYLKLSLLFIAIMASSCLMADGIQPAGSGTEVSPYQVATLDNLLWISTNTGSWDKYFIQTADIDASATSTWDDGDGGDAEGFSPIGNSTTKFIGSYDGDGYTIDGLVINRKAFATGIDYVGLIGYANNATIQNIGLTNADIKGRMYTGALVGNSTSDMITNCFSTGTVEGTSGHLGGLIGSQLGSNISNSYSECAVSGNGNYCGGFVGYSKDGTNSNCYSTGSVYNLNFDKAGGFSGYAYSVTISNCYSLGNVTRETNDYTDTWYGGFSGGVNSATIKYCYSTGIVYSSPGVVWTGDLGLGNKGFVGYDYNNNGTFTDNFFDSENSQQTGIGATAKSTVEMKTESTFTNWDFTGTECGIDYDWEINGSDNDGYPFLCWQEPSVTAPTVTTQAVSDILTTTATGNGNITVIGGANITERGVYYSTTDGFDDGTGTKVSTTGDWSAIGDFTQSITGLTPGTTYYVKAFATNSAGAGYGSQVSFTTLTLYSGGTGISGSPYQIATLADLQYLSEHSADWSKYFKQTSNIDASATSTWNYNGSTYDGFSPIGNSSTQLFTGSYDGQDYEISNLYISRTKPYNGLFGYAGGGATFSSIHLIDLNYSNSDADFDYVGGLVGYVESTTASTITNCTSTGEIFGDRGLGGLIGGIKNLAVISDCSSDVDVSGTGSNHGGFVGSVVSSSTTYYVSFSNCSASGNVSTSEGTAIGGFGGWFEGDCSSCYASGNVTNTNSGYTRTGGFLGVLNSYSSGSFTPSIENCYCTGNVHAKGSSGSYMGVGGFIGQDFNSTSSGNITNCYSVGTVTAPNLSSSYVGGFIGDSQSGSTITACFWNSNTTDQSVGIGRISDPVELHKSTTAAMKTESTYTDENWDFTITPIWAIKSGTTTSYPYLAANAQIPAPGEDLTWTGAVSSNWSTPGNWNGNALPPLLNNAIIPSGLDTYPIISSSTGANCNNLTVENGASLTINFGASLITNGTITNNGTINVEQDIDGGAWHFIAAPVSGAVSEIYDGNYLQKWSEIEQKWLDITTLTEPLTAAKGFSLWYEAKTPGTTFTFSGTPFTGDQSIDLYYNGSKGTPDGHIGTNLVGNPYPSYIDWNELSAYGSKYTWNGTGYDVYVPAGDYGEGSQYVAPMEGFFVVAGSSGSFDLDNTVRTHNSAKKEAAVLSNAIVLSAQSESYSDALYIVFDENAGENFEQLRDAWKFISGTRGICQLWTECSDGILAVDVRPQTESIQLGFANNEAGTYSIAIKEIADISTAILEDTKLNIFHNLIDGAYSFDWVLTDDETRFKLHCNTTAVEDISLPEMQVYVAAGNIIIKSQTTAQRIILTDITGRTLGVWESVESIPAPKTAGVYLVSIESDGQRITEKLIVE